MNRSRNATISSILEKGLSSTRAATKQSAIEALLLYIELDKADPIIDDLLPGLSNKQPKVITATLAALTTIYHAYGVKVVDPKPVLKALPKAFGHADKNVRAEASNLAVELYRWLREAMKKLLWAELKPVQQQDLEKLFEAVEREPAPKQERLLRSQQAAAAARPKAAEEDGIYGEDEEEQPAQVDAFDLAEPFDVLGKTPKDFQEGLASTKWKERKEALDAFFAVANKDRIKEGPFDEIIQDLAKCMKDANIAVVTVAANCVDVLAKGLRKGFAKYRGRIMAPIMERLKEKKQSVADALGQALDSVFGSTGLTDCMEDILEYLKHKNPQVKQETVKFLIRCLRTTRVAPAKPETKSIAEAATKLLTESSEVTRSGGAEILGTLMKIMGERAMGPYLEGLDDIRKTKIKEYFDVAEVKAKDKPKPDAAPPKTAPIPQKKLVSKKPSVLGAKKPAPRAPTPPAEESVTIQPKPTTTARSIPSKIGNLPKSGLAAPGTGLKFPNKLTGPGGSGPPAVSSPTRNINSPTYEENTAPVPKLGRGLAGRPLNKPGPNPPEMSQPHPQPALSAMEKVELEELRAENERLKTTVDSLRSEKSKLTSQIHELQNQNAQIIEDHTRDVLSIKAKETQLVRARADAEAAEQTVQKQQREIERLKRELSRTVRAGSPSLSAGVSDQIYRDTSSNGTARHRSLERYNSSMSESREIGFQRAKSYMSSPSEEKENSNSGVVEPKQKKKAATATSENSAPATTAPPAPLSRTKSGPGQAGQEVRKEAQTSSNSTESGEGWKNAARVTTQLKHRIELMKVRVLATTTSQQLSPPKYL